MFKMVSRYKAIRVNGIKIDEHRHIMQEYLGRKLTFNEIVHHIDGNSRNNSLDNLKLLSRTDHTKEHLYKGDYFTIDGKVISKRLKEKAKENQKNKFKNGCYLCCKCNIFKEPSEYHKDRTSWSGLYLKCKQCRAFKA